MTRIFALLTVVTFIGCADVPIDEQLDVERNAIIGDAGIFAIGSPKDPTAIWEFDLKEKEGTVLSLAPKWEGFAWALGRNGYINLSDNEKEFLRLTFYEVDDNLFVAETEKGFVSIIPETGQLIVDDEDGEMAILELTEEGVVTVNGLALIIGDCC